MNRYTGYVWPSVFLSLSVTLSSGVAERNQCLRKDLFCWKLSRLVAMSEQEQLETELKRLLNNPSLKLPLSCSRILGHLIANGSSIRLSDQPRLESLLYKLADGPEACISMDRDVNGISITEVHMPYSVLPPLKRKRSNSDGVHKNGLKSNKGTSLVLPPSADSAVQEVFALLQKGTTRAKLLAEQVGDFPRTWIIKLRLIPWKARLDKRPIRTDLWTYNQRYMRQSPTRFWLASQQACMRESASWNWFFFGLQVVWRITFIPKIHFRPLIRPHTDVSLGHCSYLNTCYSEPTYALSPSIPPFPSSNIPRPPSSASLPSGLGAGGRGKEKAPCRYLHFEVDYDGTIPEAERDRRRVISKKDGSQENHGTHKLGIGLGPGGVDVDPVSFVRHHLHVCLHPLSIASTTVDQLWSTQVWLFSAGQVPCYNGRSALGHSYECLSPDLFLLNVTSDGFLKLAPIWNTDRWWNESDANASVTGWGVTFSLGHWPCHGGG